MPILKI